MIKNIIFDMGGVLVHSDPRELLARHFAPELHSLVNDATFASDEWPLMDKGELTSQEAIEIMCARLPQELRDETRKMLTDREAEYPPNEEMYPVAEQLKAQGYKIYLLSNCPEWFYEFKPSVPTFRFFDGFIVSAFCRQIKPEEDIYRTLFREFSLNPQECFFIDDLPANVATGERLGMKAYCFADGSIENLKKALELNGIKIN